MSEFLATHYCYLSGPDGMREPVALLNFKGVYPEARRFMIHQQLAQGRLVAACPGSGIVEIRTLKDLEDARAWCDGRR